MAILILLHKTDGDCVLYITVQLPLLISPVIMVLVMLNSTAASCVYAKILKDSSILSCHYIILYYVATYRVVKNFGSKKVWRIRAVGSLAEKTLVN